MVVDALRFGWMIMMVEVAREELVGTNNVMQ